MAAPQRAAGRRGLTGRDVCFSAWPSTRPTGCKGPATRGQRARGRRRTTAKPRASRSRRERVFLLPRAIARIPDWDLHPRGSRPRLLWKLRAELPSSEELIYLRQLCHSSVEALLGDAVECCCWRVDLAWLVDLADWRVDLVERWSVSRSSTAAWAAGEGSGGHTPGRFTIYKKTTHTPGSGQQTEPR